MKKLCFLGVWISIFVWTSCNKEEDIVLETNEEYAGGATTVFSTSPSAYTFPSNNLDAEGMQKHLDADKAFAQTFVSAPSNNFGGLGPIFNQNSCENCHVRNGKGMLPLLNGDNSSGALMRLSLPGYSPTDGNIPVPGFGFQFQTKAIFGGTPEGALSFTQVQKIVEFLDGTTATLTKTNYQITDTYIPLPENVQTSFRTAPAVIGLGLIEAIAANDILQYADPYDSNQDGISGKANSVHDILTDKMVLGRFGWKAGQPSILQQSAAAAANDMGLTNILFKNENCINQSNCQIGLQEGLDLSDKTLHLMAYYTQTLAVPATRNVKENKFKEGKQIFTKIQCASCHIPSYTTSTHEIAELSHQKIFPYSDFLLHDMGADLADHRSEFDADGNEWRTPPLWGLGLVKIVNTNTSFLHDGRANTIEEAILWHGGEAENSRNSYLQLNKEERDKLLYFLNSL